ncbi:lauroyl acyltransferase [Tabrizicola sp. TH137]|uniref:lysophospholipid acyltransferase family protein n=1 Tax=Tabrizicola sp. TH137 TaxID=2067452 RepID=UPI000C7B5911|nr:lysophospholipid acyltransferase family protein [Tabrizicola sp. TH137]PLL12768.1 lauroyl acyltransferase [Tabrizicola sp. TH137]
MALIQSRGKRLADWLTDRMIRAALWLVLRLPFESRRRLAAALIAHVVAPLAGWRRRIRDNLALVRPDLPDAERRRLERAVPRSIGRTLAELYSGPDFVARVAREPLQGPGVPALEEAHRTGRPVLLVTGHLGNYDAIRGGLIARGYRVGGLYRPMDNAFFNEHYVAAISRIGTPLFPRGRKGLAEMIRFLKGGGMVGVVLDQSMGDGAMLSFFGQPALTSLSPAEMALRYDALVLPTYGLRRPDGGFDLRIEAPIPHSTAEEMTQALNDSLEAQVRTHMDQWLWTHRRWKMSNRLY